MKNTENKQTGDPAIAAIWFGVSIYLNSALLLLATPIFTRTMSTAEYGEVTLFNAWTLVLGTFATLSLSGGVLNNAILEFEKNIDRYVSAMMGLTVVCSAVSFSMLLLLQDQFGNFTGVRFSLMAFMFVNFIFNQAYLFWRTIERFHFRYRMMAAISIPCAIIGIGAAVWLMSMPALAQHKVEVRAIGAALPLTVAGAVIFCSLLVKGGTFWDGFYWKHALVLSLPLIPHYLAQAFLQQFDKFAIESTLGKHDVGLYGLAGAIASGLTLFWTAINASWTPWMLKKIHTGDTAGLSQPTGQIVMAVGLLCILGSLLAPEAVGLLAPTSYDAAAKLVPGLLLGSFFQFSQSLYLTVQFYKKRSTTITLCSLASAAFNLILNYFLIGHFGAEASAWIMAASHALQLVIHHAIVRLNDDILLASPLFLLGSAVGVSAASILASLAGPYTLIRLPIAGALGVAAVLMVVKIHKARKMPS